MGNEQEKYGKEVLACKQWSITENVSLAADFSVKALHKEYSHSPPKKITHQIAVFTLHRTSIYH